ncbi:MAG: hypothetical protein AAFR65_02085 [Pseudomonadota bacterium]
MIQSILVRIISAVPPFCMIGCASFGYPPEVQADACAITDLVIAETYQNVERRVDLERGLDTLSNDVDQTLSGIPVRSFSCPSGNKIKKGTFVEQVYLSYPERRANVRGLTGRPDGSIWTCEVAHDGKAWARVNCSEFSTDENGATVVRSSPDLLGYPQVFPSR